MQSRYKHCFRFFLTALILSTTPCSNASDYRLLAGDIITISVWGEGELSGEVRVTPSGRINFPLAGNIDVNGKTPSEVEKTITKRLKKYIPDAQVSVVLVSSEGNKVYILGKVEKPGVVLMNSPMTVLQALAMAGGLNKFAKEDKIRVVRKQEGIKETQLKVNYSKILTGEDMSGNFWLRSGDTILVP